MYSVESDPSVQQQVDALPAEALATFAETRVVLETDPWSGRPWRRGKTEAEVRAHSFGRAGLVVYLILERQRRVELLTVVWAG